MKGQLFSMDFLVALVITILAISVLIHVYDFSQRTSREKELFSGRPYLLAEAVFSNASFGKAFTGYCVISPTQNSCAGFSCINGGAVASSRRLVSCSSGVCIFEVRSCV